MIINANGYLIDTKHIQVVSPLSEELDKIYINILTSDKRGTYDEDVSVLSIGFDVKLFNQDNLIRFQKLFYFCDEAPSHITLYTKLRKNCFTHGLEIDTPESEDPMNTLKKHLGFDKEMASYKLLRDFVVKYWTEDALNIPSLYI